jgi:hypothetical protein
MDYKECKKLNAIFWFLIVVVMIFLWFALSFLFKPIGKYIVNLIKDAKENMKD